MRTLRALLTILVLTGAMTSVNQAIACPMCKTAMEDQEDPAAMARPKAYMYSILFMLAMPATLFTTFGISFYRLSKKQQAINAQNAAEAE